MRFRVIDNKTGKEADPYEIALHEEWAQGLVYCDMEGFMLTENGDLMLADECGTCVYCDPERFKVVFEDERPHEKWIPCSERLPEVYGVYLATNSEGDVYEYDYSEFTVHDGKWSFLGRDVIAWMPLPKPYKKEGEEK